MGISSDREDDSLESDVEAFHAREAVPKQDGLAELRAAGTRAGVLLRGRPVTVVWISEADERTARERWPGWGDSFVVDEPFHERRQRMERYLRERRGQGDGPFVIVTIDVDRYAAWCAEHGYEATDRRSRSTFVEEQRALGGGRAWPPGRNAPCWCGAQGKYKRCCGG